MKLGTFSTDFRKMHTYQNFIKIRLVGAELFHADGQTWQLMTTGQQVSLNSFGINKTVFSDTIYLVFASPYTPT